MTSITCAFAWLCAVLMVPLMMFLWALDPRKPELTDIENMVGAGRRLLIFTALVLQLLGGGVWHKKGAISPLAIRLSTLQF